MSPVRLPFDRPISPAAVAELSASFVPAHSFTQVLDLTVMVTLTSQVWIDRDRAVREFGEVRAAPLIAAQRLGVGATTLEAAVSARAVSALRHERHLFTERRHRRCSRGPTGVRT